MSRVWFYGGGLGLLGKQALAVVVVLAYSFTVTWLIAKAIQVTIGLRVRPEDEHEGLDVTEHGETAYVTETMAVTVYRFGAGGSGCRRGRRRGARDAGRDHRAAHVDSRTVHAAAVRHPTGCGCVAMSRRPLCRRIMFVGKSFRETGFRGGT